MPSMKIAPILLLLLLIVPQRIISDEGNDADNPTMLKPPGTNDPKMTLIPKKSRPPQVQNHSPPSPSPTSSGSTAPPSPSTELGITDSTDPTGNDKKTNSEVAGCQNSSLPGNCANISTTPPQGEPVSTQFPTEEAPFVLQPGTFKYHRGLKRFNGHTGQWTHRREREEEEEWKPVAFTWDDEGHEYWEFEDGPGVGDEWVALEEEDETQLSDSAMERPERHLRADKDCPSSVTVCDDEDESAQTVCQRWNGLPAKIGNAFDNGFLDGLLQFGISSDSAYIGVEKNNAGEWTNSDGSPLTYKNWGSGEPYNGPGRCALMKTATGKWAATECSNIQPYVCDPDIGPVKQHLCPTLGTSAYILVTLTPDIDISAFVGLLKGYSALTQRINTKYQFIFGASKAAEFYTDDLLQTIDEWVAKPELLAQYYNQSLTNSTADVHVFSSIQDPATLNPIFTADADFHFPESLQQEIRASNGIFVVAHKYLGRARRIFLDTVSGEQCHPGKGRMNDRFMTVRFAGDSNDTAREMDLPWIGNLTADFGQHCFDRFENQTVVPSSESGLLIIEDFLTALVPPPNVTFTFASLLLGNDFGLVEHLQKRIEQLETTTPFHIWADGEPDSIYTNVTVELMEALSSDWDHLILPYTFYDNRTDQATVCRDVIPQVRMLASKPYHKPKHFYLAVEDIIWMTVCAAGSAIIVGYLIYRKAYRLYQEQLDVMGEIAMQPLQYRPKNENVRMARLPWEIKADRVHIDRECLLGEGTHSDVYLGRLKGKAPIMQWMERVEMRQYQDCAVAVRVPRRFDEAEEEQLFREVASMRRLRSHAHIALFLGWSSIDNLVCSLIELTHTSFRKYLQQLEESSDSSSTRGPPRLPFKQLFQIIWQVCDGMAYIHQRHLIHRDLAARNILLTSELRPKISGFNFCSDPGDPKFGRGSTLLRRLPARWMAPEAYLGQFIPPSDVWSFGVLLWQAFSYGAFPFPELRDEEAVHLAYARGTVPPRPELASRHVYTRMCSCWLRNPMDRPTFPELRDSFYQTFERLHENPGFIMDE
ncbi:unnamed protein product, partial [Mesorhabditis spiculigera]